MLYFGSDGDTDANHVGAYFSYTKSGFYLDASALYTDSDHDSSRRLAIDMLDTDPLFSEFAYDALESDASGDLWGFSLLLGGQLTEIAGWSIEPQLRVDYAIGQLDGFAEEDSYGEEMLVIEDTDVEFLDTALQVYLSKLIHINDQTTVIPEVVLGWGHSFDIGDHDTSGRFIGATEDFDIEGGVGEDTDNFLVTAGGRVLLGKVKDVAVEVSLHYDGSFGTRGDQHSVFSTLNFGF